MERHHLTKPLMKDLALCVISKARRLADADLQRLKREWSPGRASAGGPRFSNNEFQDVKLTCRFTLKNTSGTRTMNTSATEITGFPYQCTGNTAK